MGEGSRLLGASPEFAWPHGTFRSYGQNILNSSLHKFVSLYLPQATGCLQNWMQWK
jgi:hypothetical protein